MKYLLPHILSMSACENFIFDLFYVFQKSRLSLDFLKLATSLHLILREWDPLLTEMISYFPTKKSQPSISKWRAQICCTFPKPYTPPQKCKQSWPSILKWRAEIAWWGKILSSWWWEDPSPILSMWNIFFFWVITDRFFF